MIGIITLLIDFCLHIGKYLEMWATQYGLLAYVFLFIIIYCETGLVVTPFLPGDSLLFISGTLAASQHLNLFILIPVFLCAALFGDMTNFTIGKTIGQKIYDSSVKHKGKMAANIDKTRSFFDRHGGKTIVFARFMPIIRTFTPFVAGAGKMKFPKFILFSVIAAVSWTTLFLIVGFFIGNIQWVKDNHTLIIYSIVFVSLMPAVIGIIKSKLDKKKAEAK